jgi:hypothetical protein
MWQTQWRIAAALLRAHIHLLCTGEASTSVRVNPIRLWQERLGLHEAKPEDRERPGSAKVESQFSILTLCESRNSCTKVAAPQVKRDRSLGHVSLPVNGYHHQPRVVCGTDSYLCNSRGSSGFGRMVVGNRPRGRQRCLIHPTMDNVRLSASSHCPQRP